MKKKKEEELEKLRVFGYDKNEFLRYKSIRGSLSYKFLTSYESLVSYMSSKKPRTNSIEAVSPNPYIEKYEEIKKKYRCEVFDAVRSVTNSTLKTKWVTREIDKITSMIYFIIVVSVFIWATLFVQGFLDKFVVTFQGGNQTSVGDAMSSACSPVGSFTKGSWGSDPTK